MSLGVVRAALDVPSKRYVCSSDASPARSPAQPGRGLCLRRLPTPLGTGRLAVGWRSLCRCSGPGQLGSASVLVWFVEHVVYGQDLYYLELDELQIKEHQMNEHVAGGSTLCRGAVQRFGESQHVYTHTHTHTQQPITICGCMNPANPSFIDTHHFVC